jgi:hypothetical protein
MPLYFYEGELLGFSEPHNQDKLNIAAWDQKTDQNSNCMTS